MDKFRCRGGYSFSGGFDFKVYHPVFDWSDFRSSCAIVQFVLNRCHCLLLFPSASSKSRDFYYYLCCVGCSFRSIFVVDSGTLVRSTTTAPWRHRFTIFSRANEFESKPARCCWIFAASRLFDFETLRNDLALESATLSMGSSTLERLRSENSNL